MGEVAKGVETLIFFTRSSASRHFIGGWPDGCIVAFQEEVEKAEDMREVRPLGYSKTTALCS